jgi:HD domain
MQKTREAPAGAATDATAATGPNTTAAGPDAATPDASWRPRPVLSAAVRLLAYAAPIAAGTLAVRLVVPALTGGLPRLAAAVVALLLAVIVSLLVSRLSLRLMPLVVLLRMTMLFPDRAPSRLKVARRATSMREITKLLQSPKLTEHEAAETMLSLVTALGRHDRRTRGHSERVRLFCDLLSRELDLSTADAGRLRWAALIHDIGKLEVAASVLNKAGSLNVDEWRQVKRHPEAGAALAAPLASWLGPWFSGIAEHHERYDGTGYPLGLAGGGISLAGRAVAVVDAFETMTAARSYKAARSTLSARAELTHCAGTHFDPAMVRAFLQIALPRLLWSVGPLAFLVNAPFLRWLGEGGVRVIDAAAATTATATSAAGITAVAVAVGTLPAGAASAAPHRPPTSVVKVHATSLDKGTPRSSVVGGGSDPGSGGLGSVNGQPGDGSGAGNGGHPGPATGAEDPTAGSTGTGSPGSTGGTSSGTAGGTAGGSTGGSGGGTGGGTSGGSTGGVGGAVGGTVGSVTKTVGDTVGTTVGAVGKTVGGTLGALSGTGSGSSGSGSGSSASGSSGSGSTGSGSSGSGSGTSGTSGSGSSGSGSSGSSGSGSSGSGSAGSGSGSLGGAVTGIVCSLPLALCPHTSH